MRRRIKMEKTKKRDVSVRRVYTRHSPSYSGPNNKKRPPFFLVSDYLKKEKMGSGDVDDDTTRKFKLPKKVFVDYGGPVDPACVPRKLRSAIKKRRLKSGSVPLLESKRLKHSVNGVERLKEDYFQKRKNGGLDSISKEEEEVAETLFALAGMIPLNAESSVVKNKRDDDMPSSTDTVIVREELKTACRSTSNEVTNASVTAEGLSDHVQAKPMIEPETFSWSKLSERRRLNLNIDVPAPPVHLQTIPPLLRACDERQLSNSTLFSTSTKSGLHDRKQENGLFTKTQSKISLGAADKVPIQEFMHATSTEIRHYGSTSRSLHGFGVDRPPLQSSAVMFPSWLESAATSHRPGSCRDTISADKVSCSTNGGRSSWKRCMAHVHISRMILGMQTAEGKELPPSDVWQLKQSQGSSVVPDQGDASGTVTGNHMFASAASKTICKTGSSVALNASDHQNLEDGSSSSGFGGLKKQSFNFLSLSTGAGSEANSGVNRGNSWKANGHELHQQSALTSNAPMPNNHLPSNSCRDQDAVKSMAPPAVPPQAHLQLPSYFGNPFGPAHMGTTRNTQQQQQQQQIWSAQLATQYRPGQLLPSHIVNWQNRLQAQLPSSQPSAELIGAKYLHISQQQQLLGLYPSLPTSNGKPQNGPLPSICEDKGGRFRPDGVLPLQVLCSERI